MELPGARRRLARSGGSWGGDGPHGGDRNLIDDFGAAPSPTAGVGRVKGGGGLASTVEGRPRVGRLIRP